MTARALLPHRDTVLQSIADSTGLHPWNAEVRALVAHALEAYAGRATAAAAAREARSESIRAGVLSAAGVAPLQEPGAAHAVYLRILRRGPEFYGLKAQPDQRTIASILEAECTRSTSPST